MSEHLNSIRTTLRDLASRAGLSQEDLVSRLRLGELIQTSANCYTVVWIYSTSDCVTEKVVPCPANRHYRDLESRRFCFRRRLLDRQ